MNFLNKYFISAMGINGLFKCYDTYNAKVTRDNNEETDMLLIEKFAIISAHTIAGPYILPFSLYNNLWLIEFNAKNKDVNEYYPEINKRDNRFADHLFRIL